MKKKYDFYDFLVFIFGLVGFAFYYLLMTEVIKIDPFKGFAIIPTIYFIISIFTMVSVYGLVNDKIGDIFLVTYRTVHLVSYVFGPIIFIYEKIKNAA